MTDDAERMRMFNQKFKKFRAEKHERLLDMLATQIAELFLKQCCSENSDESGRGNGLIPPDKFDEIGQKRYDEGNKGNA